MRTGLPRAAFPFAIFLLLATGVSAQKPAAPPSLEHDKTARDKPATPDYSKEASVIEELRFNFKFENDGTGHEVQYARARIQSPQAVQNWGQLVFTYDAASDKPHVDFVRVHKPGGQITTAGPDAVQDLSSPVERVAPVYSDLRQLHVTVPDLSVGDTIEYQLSSETIHPLVPGQFFLQWNESKQAITLDNTLVVDTPAGRNLQVQTAPTIDPPQIKDENGRRIYTWHCSLLKLPDESADDDKTKKKKKKKPEDDYPDVQLSTFSSWEQVGEWYSTLERPRAVVTDAIRAKAEELIKGQTTDLEKAKAIYDYVSKNIRYVSLSFGIGMYQPHLAADVLSNQYGDCKDKATLLQALLAVENIPSYPVLINAERKIDPRVPSPGQFDHLINIVKVAGKSYWADSTPGSSPFEYLLPQLRDKQALAVTPDSKPSLIETPVDPPFMPEQEVTVEGTVDSLGRLQGTLSIKASGDSAVTLTGALRLLPQSMWPKVSDRLLQILLGSEAKSTDSHFGDPSAIEQPFTYSAKFTDPNYLDLSKKEATLSLPENSIELPAADQPDKGDTEPMKIGVIGDKTVRWKILLPDQITATLPIPVHMTRDYAEYQSVYSFEGHTAILERHLIVRQSKIPPLRYDDLMAFRATVISDEDQRLTLANSAPGASSIPAGMSYDDLYQAARDAERDGNYPQAERLYAAAAAKEPDHTGVWNDVGHMYNVMQRYSDAIEPLQKAIAINAYDPYAYNNLGLAYQGLGRYDDAVAQFQKQISVNPLDRYAHANLGALYLTLKKYDLALKELQTALQITPASFLLNVSLGQAELALHQDSAALDAFQKALEKSPSPVTWNNVAWAMAETGSHLDLATQYSQNSIRATEAQLNAATLATVGRTQAALTTSLPNYWDTMGWIKFKQNDWKAAEEYIGAAWMVNDDATVGDHLGQIYEKEGRKSDAVHTYALALLCPRPLPETRGRLATLVGEKKVQAEIDSVRPELAARRTVTMPNPQKLDGTGEYWVLLGPGAAVADAKFISGDAKVNGLADSIRAAKFPYSIPAGESTQLLLRGVLDCSTLSKKCTFTAYPGDQALRVTALSSSPE